jgi:hypothetical protein
MAAYDNVAMPGAPQAPSYAAPLLDFSPIGNLPKDFYEGAEQKRAYDLQRAFQNGIPRDANGNIDYSGMADTLARKGGIDQAIGIANTGAQLQASNNFSGMMSGQPQQQPRPTAPVFAPPPQQQPQGGPVASPDQGNNGGDTVRSVVTEAFGGRDVSAAIPRLAQSIGVQPDAPLTPQQVAQLKQRLQPAQERVPQQQPQPAPQAQPQQGGASIPPALAGLIPANWPGTVQSFRDRIAAAATSPMLPPAAQKVAQERLKAIDAAIAKDAERTPEMKNAAASGLATPVDMKKVEKRNDTDVTEYSKLYTGLSSAGTTSAQMLPNIQLAKGLINDPQFYSGSAEALNLGYKRFLSSVGIEPGASLPQEAFRKVMASTILHQVDDMKAAATEMGSSSSRIFASQIELMEKAAQNPDNTVEANKFLTELSERAANRNMQIANMAADYKIKHGGLDAQFEKNMREWLVKNPMFTEAELKNTKTIGQTPKPPVAGSASDGATATNPDTGQKLIRQNGKWVPVI